MDALSILHNAIWQDAQRPRRRVTRPNSVAEIAAFARRLRRAPRLVYSTVVWQWLAQGRPVLVSDRQPAIDRHPPRTPRGAGETR